MSPYNYEQRLDTVELCREKGIIIEAYSPLTKATKLGDPRLVRIAEKYGKTSAQVLIRWSVQKEFVVLPKSVKQHRIIENADIFDFSISENDMAVLDGFNEDLATGWDPTDAP
jgi:diketogulonate reductase-like aldo/keto reductase